MATLKDIAARAEVDVSIVSRILHKREFGRASAQTRERIERVARELGYEPNGLARSLVRQKTDMVELVLPDLYDPVFVRYLEVIDEELDRHGMQVIPMLSRWSAEREARLLGLARQCQVDGVISFYFDNISDISLYKELKQRKIPVVFRAIDDEVQAKGFDRVTINIAEGAYVLTRHLMENGFRKVALLGGFGTGEMAQGHPPKGLAVGYLRAHREAGLPFDPRLAIACRDDGLDAAERLLEQLERYPGFCDAILVQSSSKLPGVYRALAQRGLQIGRDIGLVSVTDSEFCHLSGVPVTVWEQPVAEIGASLVELLVRRLRGPDAKISKIALQSQLIVRPSSVRG